MTVTRARLDRMSSGLVRGKSAETTLPIRLDKFDRRPTQFPLDSLTNEVVTWARLVATETGQLRDLFAALESFEFRQAVHARRHRKHDPAWLSTETAVDAELAAIWLADHAGYLAWLPAIAEMHDSITSAIARCRKEIDRLPELSYKGPCPHVSFDEERQPFTCSADLYVERGEDYVSCPRCWTHHRVRDLELLMVHALNEQLFTLAEIDRLLRELGEPIPIGTLYSWHSRKVIEPQAWRQGDGTISNFWMRRSDPPLFRLGDIREARVRGVPVS
ncbi:hypothetical protein R4P64_07800 [Rhodococcus sp. IEGM 1366]|uniref:hypothetical protein n=1 Tax=Rhodococcus sp. IEGM 1366 TaxID=3082223 RepID=UPI002954B7B0|nr:hypothetical protein [Rhodococcus sp. IEGM 1366]MDV8066404.1 hypothetical protein [Rhodococcus sp. IEGM 1366]